MVNCRKKNRRWQTFSPSSDASHIVTDLWFDRSRSPATSTLTIVVNTAAQFDELYEEHLSSDKSTSIIGFDAEWVSAENYLVRPTASTIVIVSPCAFVLMSHLISASEWPLSSVLATARPT